MGTKRTIFLQDVTFGLQKKRHEMNECAKIVLRSHFQPSHQIDGLLNTAWGQKRYCFQFLYYEFEYVSLIQAKEIAMYL